MRPVTEEQKRNCRDKGSRWNGFTARDTCDHRPEVRCQWKNLQPECKARHGSH